MTDPTGTGMIPDELRAANHLYRLASAPEADARLLERFARDADGAAFTELVRRYGPMVLGVCRRVLGTADADDAFQAAFLVLARRAGAVRANALGGWLFGVARFVAVRARDKARRRREHEERAARVPPAEPPDPDLLAAVDAELERLPARYRGPLVACFLRGRTQDEAARDLGCSLSTLRRRLDRGLELLRERLSGRVAVPALGALAVGLPAGSVEAATGAAVAFIRGTAPAVPATALAREFIVMGTQTRLKALALVLALGGLVGGVAWQLGAAQPDPNRPAPDPNKVAAPDPNKTAPADPNKTAPAPKEKGGKPAEDRIKPGDRLVIRGENDFDAHKVEGIYVVEASGKVALSPRYGGRVKVDGLTLEEAEKVVQDQVRQFAKYGLVQITRAPAEPITLEDRVRQLEKEVKELRAAVNELRGQKSDPRP